MSAGHVIAIDGPAGAGKSTVAKAVAQRLGWSLLDTGAMYRAVTYVALTQGLSLDDESALAAVARNARIETQPHVVINGHDVSEAIRTPQVNQAVSLVATLAAVREALVEQQRAWAQRQPKGVVVEGRDMTTVVFPSATVKIFLTADADVRQARRGEDSGDSVRRRDEIDSTRTASPLTLAPDARMVDTTDRSVEDVVEEIVSCLEPKK